MCRQNLFVLCYVVGTIISEFRVDNEMGVWPHYFIYHSTYRTLNLHFEIISRGYVMMKELRDMIHDNNWQQLPAFASYMKSIEGLPRVHDKTKPGREMMDAIAEAFF